MHYYSRRRRRHSRHLPEVRAIDPVFVGTYPKTISSVPNFVKLYLNLKFHTEGHWIGHYQKAIW